MIPGSGGGSSVRSSSTGGPRTSRGSIGGRSAASFRNSISLRKFGGYGRDTLSIRRRRPRSRGLLTEAQLRILELFKSLPDAEHYYLTGGTALAEFYLGHRRSFDLDLFTTEAGLILPFSRVLEERFQGEGFSIRAIRRLASFAEFEIGWEAERVRVHLAYDSPYRLASPEETALVRVNDFPDLAVDKLLAFFGRAEPRDAVDLVFILEVAEFKELVRLAARKDPGFDLYWLAVALEKVQSFPDEVERWPVEMVKPLDVGELKTLFRSLAEEIMDGLNPGQRM